MPCILVLLGVLSPRLLMIILGIFTDWFSQAQIQPIWAVLGWFFMPITTLMYMAAMFNNNNQVSGIWILLMFFAVLFDLAANMNANINKNKQ